MRFNVKRMAVALRRFSRARRGTAAVEFAFLAAPVLLLTVGVGEVATIGLAQTTLAHAVAETARGIRTGEVQTNGLSATQVHERLCTEMGQIMVVDCPGSLFLDVKTFESFVNIQNESPIQGGVFDSSDFDFDPGTSSSIVVVRAYYRWHILTPFFQNVLRNVAGGDRILVNTLMFRNEPF